MDSKKRELLVWAKEQVEIAKVVYTTAYNGSMSIHNEIELVHERAKVAHAKCDAAMASLELQEELLRRLEKD